jgi:hypothetical protein
MRAASRQPEVDQEVVKLRNRPYAEAKTILRKCRGLEGFRLAGQGCGQTYRRTLTASVARSTTPLGNRPR